MDRVTLILFIISVKTVNCQRLLEGARYAGYREFLYVVSIQERFSKGHRCTGVLITMKHVMTAGQCVAEYDRQLGITLKDHRGSIVYGLSRFTQELEIGIYRYIYKWTAHPRIKFVYGTYWGNDVGVITLEGSFSLDTASPVAVFTNESAVTKGAAKELKACFVLGFGWKRYSWQADPDETAQHPDQLKVINVTLKNESTCELVIRGVKPMYTFVNLTLVQASCADYGDQVGCFGEPGAPVVCGGELFGLSSWSVGCGKLHGPLVYSNLNPILDFYLNLGFEKAGTSAVKFRICPALTIALIGSRLFL